MDRQQFLVFKIRKLAKAGRRASGRLKFLRALSLARARQGLRKLWARQVALAEQQTATAAAVAAALKEKKANSFWSRLKELFGFQK